jgi:hypothetical protein
MNEMEWLNSTDPQEMLVFLDECGGWASGRKLRLFAVACCRRLPRAATYGRARKALEVAERYADGSATLRELREVGQAAWKGARWARDGTRDAAVAASQACSSAVETHSFLTCVNVLCNHAAPGLSQASRAALREERVALVGLLRCVFGNPFRAKPGIERAWLPPSVLSIARRAYDERDFAALPVLADALADAGCDNEDLLRHCRERGLAHCRGCWVVDLLLGKG